MSLMLGRQLKFVRTSYTDFTQTDISRLLHIDHSTYSKYELGYTEPPIDTLKRIAKIFGVSVDLLVNWELNDYIQY